LFFRNAFWTFLKCPFSEKADSPLQKPGKKAVVIEMLSFSFFCEKCCDANFFVFLWII